MSRVTNIIVSVDILEPSDWLARVNSAIAEPAQGQQLRRVYDAVGGSKAWEAETAEAAFNHFGPYELRDALRTVEWRFPENVQVIYQDQHDATFSILTLWDVI